MNKRLEKFLNKFWRKTYIDLTQNQESDSTDWEYKVQVNFSVTEARRITLYRDDSTTQVVYENVKHIFWLANNSVLCIAQYTEEGNHHYINWPRERFAWYKDEKVSNI